MAKTPVGRTILIYIVEGGGEHASHHATMAEALKTAAHRSLDIRDEPIYVSRCRTVPITKSVLLDLMNSDGGYVATSDEVACFKDGHRVR